MNQTLVWSIAAGSIAGVIFRPKAWPEAVWPCLGALLLLVCRAISPGQAAAAIGKGTDVYLFLAGMMLLADLARHEGVFDWLATHAVLAARGSRLRLFWLIYAVGIGVTALLSNDATAVVLTPAVAAAVRKAKSKPLPYLLACAFISNAASFVLPISNPANLVVYGARLPALLPWLRVFGLPAALSIGATYAALRWRCREELKGGIEQVENDAKLSPAGRRAAWGIAGTAVALITASALGWNLGLATFLAALAAVAITVRAKAGAAIEIAREVSWSVLPLVAGLFILVEALAKAGASRDLGTALQRLEQYPAWAGTLLASFGIAAISNVMNNLPAGLIAGSALAASHAPAHIRDAVLIGVDLGPNLSVTGSLATMLWLIALRRDGEQVSGWTFLKIGATVMTPALVAAALGLLI